MLFGSCSSLIFLPHEGVGTKTDFFGIDGSDLPLRRSIFPLLGPASLGLHGGDLPHPPPRLWNGHLFYDGMAHELRRFENCTHSNFEYWLEDLDGMSLPLPTSP